MFEGISSWWRGSSAPAPAAPAAKKEFDPSDPKQNPLNPKGLKPCCACPETKSARDECFLKHGEEATERCKWLVKAHIECMRSYGFKV